MKTPRERAEELAKEHLMKSLAMPDGTYPYRASVVGRIIYELVDTLTPILEEIEAARKMRDEFLFSDQGSERPMYILDDPESLYSYDAVRKKNEESGK